MDYGQLTWHRLKSSRLIISFGGNNYRTIARSQVGAAALPRGVLGVAPWHAS